MRRNCLYWSQLIITNNVSGRVNVAKRYGTISYVWSTDCYEVIIIYNSKSYPHGAHAQPILGCFMNPPVTVCVYDQKWHTAYLLICITVLCFTLLLLFLCLTFQWGLSCIIISVPPTWLEYFFEFTTVNIFDAVKICACHVLNVEY